MGKGGLLLGAAGYRHMWREGGVTNAGAAASSKLQAGPHRGKRSAKGRHRRKREGSRGKKEAEHQKQGQKSDHPHMWVWGDDLWPFQTRVCACDASAPVAPSTPFSVLAPQPMSYVPGGLCVHMSRTIGHAQKHRTVCCRLLLTGWVAA